MNLGELAACEKAGHRSHRGPRNEAAQAAENARLWAAMAQEVGGKFLEPQALERPTATAEKAPVIPPAIAVSFFADLARELRL